MTTAWAEDNAPVFDCLDNMDNTTTWGQCLGVAFAPCSETEFSTEDHALCFAQLYEGGFAGVENSVQSTLEILPARGKTELKDILNSWHGFAGEKCTLVGQGHEGFAADSAETACQISEIVLFSNELRRCRAGTSVETYCAGASN